MAAASLSSFSHHPSLWSHKWTKPGEMRAAEISITAAIPSQHPLYLYRSGEYSSVQISCSNLCLFRPKKKSVNLLLFSYLATPALPPHLVMVPSYPKVRQWHTAPQKCLLLKAVVMMAGRGTLKANIVMFAHTKPSVAVHLFSRFCVTKSRGSSPKAMPVLHTDKRLLCTSHW